MPRLAETGAGKKTPDLIFSMALNKVLEFKGQNGTILRHHARLDTHQIASAKTPETAAKRIIKLMGDLGL